MAEGWARTAPHDRLTLVPLSDGGPGFVDVLAESLGGEVHAVVTTDPLGREVPATILLTTGAGGRTAYVESAQAAGLHLLAPDERDPTRTTTLGVGTLCSPPSTPARAVSSSASAARAPTTPGPACSRALGVGPAARLGRGGLALAAATPDDVAGLDARS